MRNEHTYTRKTKQKQTQRDNNTININGQTKIPVLKYPAYLPWVFGVVIIRLRLSSTTAPSISISDRHWYYFLCRCPSISMAPLHFLANGQLLPFVIHFERDTMIRKRKWTCTEALSLITGQTRAFDRFLMLSLCIYLLHLSNILKLLFHYCSRFNIFIYIRVYPIVIVIIGISLQIILYIGFFMFACFFSFSFVDECESAVMHRLAINLVSRWWVRIVKCGKNL